MKNRLFGRVLAALAATFLLFSGAAQAAYKDISASSGKLRIHYPSTTPSQCTAILLGVGTAMDIDSYDNLAGEIIKKGYIVAILDHNPGNIVKTDAGKFRNLALETKSKLLSWIGTSQCNVVARWTMGGHSAGGQAAFNAMVSDAGLAQAHISIDPFDISNSGSISVPGLYWGLDVTTCFVDKEKAAKAAYYRSAGKRMFVRVNKTYTVGPCGYSPKYYHCSFADGSCPACTSCMYAPSSFYVDIAGSVDRFLKAAFGGTWSKAAVSGSMTTPVTLFVDADKP